MNLNRWLSFTITLALAGLTIIALMALIVKGMSVSTTNSRTSTTVEAVAVSALLTAPTSYLTPPILPIASPIITVYPPPIPTPWKTIVRPTLSLPSSTQTPIPMPTVFPTLPPSLSIEADEVKSIIERSYELQAIAARTFDISEFHTVYVNDPTLPLSKEQNNFVNDKMPLVQSKIPGVNGSPGLLDFWRVTFAYWQLGSERLEQRRRGMLVKPDEGPIGPPRRTDPIYKDTFRFDEIKISSKYAEVLMDDGAALRRMILIRTDMGWRIARDEALKVHF